jgi:glutamate-1-semialdehyde 2,1-aminomutase
MEDALTALDGTARLIAQLEAAYVARNLRSRQAHERATQTLVDGYSHGARSFAPYGFRASAAQGAHVTDLDGHQLTDFWQGHYANILGHNPPLILEALTAALQRGEGLQTGMLEERETAYAELLARTLGAETVRLTTAGTLATMYAMMMARAYTGRSLVVKVAGGWHGANPLALKGVSTNGQGWDHVDSAGMSQSTDDDILVTRFNDAEALRALFARHGPRIACFIVELCPSKAGFIMATPEYVAAARELTERHGALLIIDEVITGFRFGPRSMAQLYGVRADLTTLGKVMGGGMPISAVAGRADVMATISQQASERVWFNGGTFSAHPLSLVAGQAMIEHLLAHQDTIYPQLAAKGERLRRGMERAFAERGVLARCTGDGNALVPGSSLGSLHFPRRDDHHATCAEDLTDSRLCDVAGVERACKLGMLLRDVNVVHGLGAVATVHSEADLDRVLVAVDSLAQQWANAR